MLTCRNMGCMRCWCSSQLSPCKLRTAVLIQAAHFKQNFYLISARRSKSVVVIQSTQFKIICYLENNTVSCEQIHVSCHYFKGTVSRDERGYKVESMERSLYINPIASEAKQVILLKGLFTIYILRFQRCNKTYNNMVHSKLRCFFTVSAIWIM